jgi:hypothetical protein
MYVAMDQHYVTKETFDNIYQQGDKTGKMINSIDKKSKETRATDLT